MIQKELRKYANAERKASNERFFKTGPGEYSEGDKFIGVRLPDIRTVAKEYSYAALAAIKKLLHSPIHEERLLALIILVQQFERGDDAAQKKIFNFYVTNKKYVNNWDLVDVSAPNIVGAYIFAHPIQRQLLVKLVKSNSLWDRRIAMISMFTFIKNNKLTEPFRIAKKLLNDPEDLMQKATGWMLRECWKKDQQQTEQFLKTNYAKLPRTTLRYAIERVIPESRRKQMLTGVFI